MNTNYRTHWQEDAVFEVYALQDHQFFFLEVLGVAEYELQPQETFVDHFGQILMSICVLALQDYSLSCEKGLKRHSVCGVRIEASYLSEELVEFVHIVTVVLFVKELWSTCSRFLDAVIRVFG